MENRRLIFSSAMMSSGSIHAMKTMESGWPAAGFTRPCALESPSAITLAMRWRGQAGSAGPVPKRSPAGTAQLGSAKDGKMGVVKEKLVGLGSASCWVSPHCQIGVRKSFSFSNLFIICTLI
jgi:hypothetical protein